MHLTKTLLVIAPPSVLRELPRHCLAESGYFVAAVPSLEKAINVAETFASHQILVDARLLDNMSDVLEGLKASPWTQDIGVRVCGDCTSWRQLECLLNDANL